MALPARLINLAAKSHFGQGFGSPAVAALLQVASRADLCTTPWRQRLVYSWQPSRPATSMPVSDPEKVELIAVEASSVRVEGYGPTGFLVNGVELHSSILCYDDMYLLWKPRSLAEITPDSLAMLCLVRPPPEILVLGCGLRTVKMPQELAVFLTDKGIAYEAIDTSNALATFNILNQEGRRVAGAFLPEV